ncbi:agip20 [Agrotis ipsilon multiple nucleopolyhedrovirus]|uniref:Uncharacterized protein n=1 Tax=Agrotis ipsilon multiple nucleopolyhedrovirus TaxID=208013 RepID=B6D5T4_9ABAC|nr:agip20 [Agrotis ipsilon multiple nucleopolyhedrovirus]ACI28722.1 unknown [Agrotis ipsilon multiple nucleopolyhedrovirus]
MGMDTYISVNGETFDAVRSYWHKFVPGKTVLTIKYWAEEGEHPWQDVDVSVRERDTGSSWYCWFRGEGTHTLLIPHDAMVVVGMGERGPKKLNQVWYSNDVDSVRIRENPVTALEAMSTREDLARFILAFVRHEDNFYFSNSAPKMTAEDFTDTEQIRKVDNAMRLATQGVIDKNYRHPEHPKVPLGLYMRKFARRWFGGLGKSVVKPKTTTSD